MSPVRADTVRFDDITVGDTLPELVLPLDPDPHRGHRHRVA